MATRQRLEKLAGRIDALFGRLEANRKVIWLTAWQGETPDEALALHLAENPADIDARIEWSNRIDWMTREEARIRGWV